MNVISKQLIKIAKQCRAMTNQQIRELCRRNIKILSGEIKLTANQFTKHLKKVLDSNYKPLIDDLIRAILLKDIILPVNCRVDFLKKLYDYDKQQIKPYVLNDHEYTKQQIERSGIDLTQCGGEIGGIKEDDILVGQWVYANSAVYDR